jgi:phosphoglycolate phosphatase-like HAD superfamily hydrolase
MKKRKEIIAFDVDGVIFDSTEECLVIAWNAHQELIGKDEKISHPSEAKEDYDQKFRSIRNYVRSMDEYLVIFYGNISENPDQKDFEKCLGSIDDDLKKLYTKSFYNQRKEYKSRSYEQWIRLHYPYESILEILELCSKRKELFMVTGKDKGSVKDLLDYFASDVVVQEIYDKHAVENKLIALKKIALDCNVQHSEMKFIDDNVTHLFEPQKNEFNIALAEWGYAMPDHIMEAKKRNIPILSLNDLKNFIGL